MTCREAASNARSTGAYFEQPTSPLQAESKQSQYGSQGELRISTNNHQEMKNGTQLCTNTSIDHQSEIYNLSSFLFLYFVYFSCLVWSALYAMY
jgi:hypothetical protein